MASGTNRGRARGWVGVILFGLALGAFVSELTITPARADDAGEAQLRTQVRLLARRVEALERLVAEQAGAIARLQAALEGGRRGERSEREQAERHAREERQAREARRDAERERERGRRIERALVQGRERLGPTDARVQQLTELRAGLERLERERDQTVERVETERRRLEAEAAAARAETRARIEAMHREGRGADDIERSARELGERLLQRQAELEQRAHHLAERAREAEARLQERAAEHRDRMLHVAEQIEQALREAAGPEERD